MYIVPKVSCSEREMQFLYQITCRKIKLDFNRIKNTFFLRVIIIADLDFSEIFLFCIVM